VDAQTKRIPIVEVTQVVGGYGTREAAANAWRRISKDDKDLMNEVGSPRQINGQGQSVFCATPDVITQIIWSLPSKLAKAYRRQCARIITRFQMGDQSLHSEINQNKANTDANGGLPQFRAVEVDSDQEILGPFGKRKLALMAIEIEERRVEIEVKRMKLQEQRQMSIMTYANHAHELLEKLGLLCDRNRMAISDSVMNSLNGGMFGAQNSQRMLCEGEGQPKQVAEIMEHDLNLPPNVIRDHSNTAGRVAAAAFREKYGNNATFLMVNRIIDGANRQVKCYDPKDVPMITEALKNHLSTKGVL